MSRLERQKKRREDELWRVPRRRRLRQGAEGEGPHEERAPVSQATLATLRLPAVVQEDQQVKDVQARRSAVLEAAKDKGGSGSRARVCSDTFAVLSAASCAKKHEAAAQAASCNLVWNSRSVS